MQSADVVGLRKRRPAAAGFIGPPLRVLFLASDDHATRYRSAQHEGYVEGIQRLWGGALAAEVISETDDVHARLTSALARVDCVICLTAAYKQRSIQSALAACREEITNWVTQGGAVLSLESGSDTYELAWAPPGIDIRFGPAVPRDEREDLVVCTHPAATTPFAMHEAIVPLKREATTMAAATQLVGEGLDAVDHIVANCDGPLVVVGGHGQGRWAAAALYVDWRRYDLLTINLLCWLCRCTVVDAAGRAHAVRGLVHHDSRLAVRTSPAPTSRAAPGVAGTTGMRVTLSEDGNSLGLDTADPGPRLLALLEERQSAGRWDSSDYQTLEVARHLARCGVLFKFADVAPFIRRRFLDVVSGSRSRDECWLLFTLAAYSPELASPAVDGIALADALDDVPDADDPGSALRLIRYYLDARSLPSDTAELAEARHAMFDRIAAAAAAGPAWTTPERRRDARDRILERALSFIAGEHSADSAPSAPIEAADVDAYLTTRPQVDAVLDVLDLALVAEAGRPQLLTPEAVDVLAVYAYASLERAPDLQSRSLARELRFWRGHEDLLRFSQTATAAARLVVGADDRGGRAKELDDATELRRKRLAEAYAVLEIPPERRNIEQPLGDALLSGGWGPVRAGLKLLGLPLRRYDNLIAAIMPLIRVGGLGLLPLLSSSANSILGDAPLALRVILGAACLAATAIVALMTPEATRRVLGILGAALAVWAIAIEWLAWDLFPPETRHPASYGPGDVLPPAILLWAILLMLATLSVRRHSRQSQA